MIFNNLLFAGFVIAAASGYYKRSAEDYEPYVPVHHTGYEPAVHHASYYPAPAATHYPAVQQHSVGYYTPQPAYADHSTRYGYSYVPAPTYGSYGPVVYAAPSQGYTPNSGRYGYSYVPASSYGSYGPVVYAAPSQGYSSYSGRYGYSTVPDGPTYYPAHTPVYFFPRDARYY